MSNKQAVLINDNSSSWSNFTMPAGGSAREIRKSVEQLRDKVNKEKRSLEGHLLNQQFILKK